MTKQPNTKREALTNAIETREAWLVVAGATLANRMFKQYHAEPIAAFRVSVGWPKGSRGKAIGQVWPASLSGDGHNEIFISPILDDPSRVLDVLAHEIVHIAVGLSENHNKTFKRLATAIGLEGKMTATIGGEEFAKAIKPILKALGPYPHASLALAGERSPKGPGKGGDREGRHKQTTRMIKAECPECGYIIRTTQKWAKVGLPLCPTDGHTFFTEQEI